jgi:hypothetical protein
LQICREFRLYRPLHVMKPLLPLLSPPDKPILTNIVKSGMCHF